MTYFADASFLFAIFCEDDIFHNQSKEIVKKINLGSHKVVASNISLSETINLIFRLKGQLEAKKFYGYFIKTGTDVVNISKEIFQSSCKILFNLKSKKNLNFFDCLHLATMKELGIENILTFDSDFKNFVKINEVS